MSRIENRGRHLEQIAEVRQGSTSAKVGYPIRIREVEVLRSYPLGAGLIRVILGGPGTDGFEAHSPDEHVKLIFPEPDGELRLPEPNGLMLSWPRPSPTTREYTVRGYDPVTGELAIDIALHGTGLGANWARTVEPGATVHVAGPPGGLIVPHNYDRYLLAGDLTALPAIDRWLEELPRTAAGWAFIEVADASEEIELSAPEDMAVHWLHRGASPPGTGDMLERAVRTVSIPDGERCFVWLAGEAGQLKPLRRWVRDELKLAKTDYDITGYWKRGVADYDDDHEH
ncbi:NADPH-dependent ferric siderophore reductase [Tamaricihabitans halophyticus]|uniref:NADPH-dependent ferric siderophore reductase n=1 Tax=Tamaricihabitans halophyticus TaxID=1262583 RepID=A0A4R2QDU6_9PSEU|nr:siderophore-interacting protein [Tamaricihabitans halophyticus]TCP45105.1 NADPH-dependent ferric siderophore reductase [Tamaricihabitans halophyticus]